MKRNEDILLIEDDADIAELIIYNLQRQGYQVRHSAQGDLGLQNAQTNAPDLILLDLMLPGMDGLTVLRRLREGQTSAKNTPIIMLTAKGEESDIVLGLELGADDYVTKPFSPKELLARIRAILRRTTEETNAQGLQTKETSAHLQGATKLAAGPVEFDDERHECALHGHPLQLTLAEYRLLRTLVSRPGRVFTRDQLLEKITGGEAFVIDRNVDVHVRSIRKKLESDAEFITTVRGVGYKCKEV